MDIQRLRNLTTGRLHTSVDDIQADIEWLTGEQGVMTYQIPNALRALEVCLRAQVTDARCWDGAYDPTHTGEVDVRPMDEGERAAFWQRYEALPSALSLIGRGR